MKKIMPLAASIALILIAGIFASAGTLAWFSDTDKSEDNLLGTGTLYMDTYVTGSETVMFTVSDAKPGDEGYAIVNFVTRGSVSPAELDIAMSTIVNDDNGLVEPEIEAGDTSDGAGNGELGDHLEMALWIGTQKSRNDIFEPGSPYYEKCLYTDGTKGDSLVYYKANKFSGVVWNPAFPSLGSGSWRCFTISWRIPEGAGNVIQSDSITFTVTFVLEQPEAD